MNSISIRIEVEDNVSWLEQRLISVVVARCRCRVPHDTPVPDQNISISLQHLLCHLYELVKVFVRTRPRAGRVDRQEGTVLVGTLLTPRFAHSALSSEGTDCFQIGIFSRTHLNISETKPKPTGALSDPKP